MEEAERLCDRIAIVDHGRVIALGSKEEMVAQSFGSRSDVLMRFAATVQNGAEWAASRGGTVEDGVGHFSVEQPTEIASLLDDVRQLMSEQALPVRTLMKPPACWILSKALRSVTRSLTSGKAFARKGSTTIVSPSWKLRR